MVTHNESAHRFEIATNGGTAFLAYERRGDTTDLTHAFVPESMRGQGAADQLAHTALEYARTEHLSVVPTCPFVASYLMRHPEFQWLVAK